MQIKFKDLVFNYFETAAPKITLLPPRELQSFFRGQQDP
jgi:hypothetical protein